MIRNTSIFHLILCTALLLCTLRITAQTASASASTATHKPESARIDDRTEQGLSLLTQAMAHSGNYDPASRAAVYYLAGHALTKLRPQLASDSLAIAYRTVDQLRSDKTLGLAMLEGNIVRETALVIPKQVEEALPQDDAMQATALSALVEAYVNDKKIYHAIELTALIPDPYVYTAVRRLLEAIPIAEQEKRSRTFAYAIERYSSTQHTANIVGYPDDLGRLTVKFWKTLPARQVLNAIDVLLDEADPDKHQSGLISPPQNVRLTLGNVSGTRVLGLYEYRLDQVITILRSLDPQRADSLSKKRIDRAYEATVTKPPTENDQLAIGRNDTAIAQQVVAMEQTRIAESIVTSTETNLQDAVAKAEGLKDRALAARVLVGIANSYVSKDPQFAVSVLNRVRAVGSSVSSHTLDDAINIALKLDRDLAKAFLELKFAQAEEQFKKDADPNHPNTAIKLYWPSTSFWRDAFRLAYKLSPPYSVDKLKSVPDAEIESMERAMLACSFLQLPVWSDSPIGMQ